MVGPCLCHGPKALWPCELEGSTEDHEDTGWVSPFEIKMLCIIVQDRCSHSREDGRETVLVQSLFSVISTKLYMYFCIKSTSVQQLQFIRQTFLKS